MSDDPLSTDELPGENLDEAPEVQGYATPPADRDEEETGESEGDG